MANKSEAVEALVKYESSDGQEIALTTDAIRKYLVAGKSEL